MCDDPCDDWYPLGKKNEKKCDSLHFRGLQSDLYMLYQIYQKEKHTCYYLTDQ